MFSGTLDPTLHGKNSQRHRLKPLLHLQVLRSTAIYHIRCPLLCTMFLFGVAWPCYTHFVNSWLAHGLSQRTFFVVITTALHVVLYWSCNDLTLWCLWNGFFAKYQIPRLQHEVPKRQIIVDTFKEAVLSQLIAEPLSLYLIWPLYQHCGAPAINAPLPHFSVTFTYFLVAYMANDWLFYWSHRAMHSRLLYKHIHKQHHMYRGTIGFASEFQSAIEQAISAKGATAVGALMAGCHPAIWLVWVSYRLCQTYEGHSGYCFYGSWLHSIGLTNSDSAAFHDFHHTRNCGNFGFGPPSYLDYCFGTMDSWLAIGGIEGYLEQCKAKVEHELLEKIN